MGFEKIFDNLTFNLMDALRKMIQSLVDYVLNYSFRIHAILNKVWQLRKEQNYFISPIWFALKSTKDDIGQPLFTSV